MSMGIHIDAQKSTPERIAEAVRSAILRGDIAPGAPLREADIAREVGASRNTVREAMRLLAREGLITHNAFKSVTVTRLTEADVSDLFRARMVLELAGVDATEQATSVQLAALAAAVTAFDAAVAAEDWQGAFERDIDLHTALVATIGSSRLDRAILGVLHELRLAYTMFGGLETESMPESGRDHNKIVELVGKGDRAACRRLIRSHLVSSEDLLLSLMRGDRGEPVATGAPL
jgi:DNA-binding GntR family transcriptional regulator